MFIFHILGTRCDALCPVPWRLQDHGLHRIGVRIQSKRGVYIKYVLQVHRAWYAVQLMHTLIFSV